MTTKDYFEKNKFADVLFATLEGSMISQNRFARMVGVSQQTVNCWCTGKKIPSLKLFREICDALHVDANTMLLLVFNTHTR